MLRDGEVLNGQVICFRATFTEGVSVILICQRRTVGLNPMRPLGFDEHLVLIGTGRGESMLADESLHLQTPVRPLAAAKALILSKTQLAVAISLDVASVGVVGQIANLVPSSLAYNVR